MDLLDTGFKSSVSLMAGHILNAKMGLGDERACRSRWLVCRLPWQCGFALGHYCALTCLPVTKDRDWVFREWRYCCTLHSTFS